MSEKSNTKANPLAEQDSFKTATMTQHEYQSVPKQKASGSDIKPPFLVLAKDFDVDTKGSATYPKELDVPRHNGPSRAFGNPANQEKPSGYAELKRPWANENHEQVARTRDLLTPDRRFSETPLSVWRTEELTNEPFHAIGSVMDGPAVRPAPATSSTAADEGFANTDLEERRSSGRRR